MNNRIKKLRQKSLEAQPTVSHERAELLTDFYKSGQADRVSVPVARAMAFSHLLLNKQIYIGEDELIVGERGPAPKMTPTYPEICIHSLDDLKILNDREKIAFTVDTATRDVYRNLLIPFWQGRSIRDRIFNEVDDDWKEAYHAGIFTEFMEQRAPGHTVLDDKIYKKGLLDFQEDIRRSISGLDFYNDSDASGKKEELKAMMIASDALIRFANRHADLADRLAAEEKRLERKKELQKVAQVCRKVPAHKPENLWEALQYYWFVHLGVITELNTWDSFNPGRLDQHLYPFYRKALDSGEMSMDEIRELLQAFWIKFNNQPAPPKVGVTASESNTYTDFCLINLGGVKEDGSDAVNELTFLLLDIIEEMRLLQPSSMIQVSKKNPDQLIKRALKIIKTGYGQPSIFNTDAIIQELIRQGKSLIDARDGGASGCVEAGAFGKEAYILTGYFNLVKVLEITLNNGMDPLTGKQIGLKTGDPEAWQSFDELFDAYQKQLRYFIDIKIKGNLIIERLWAEYLPAPFMSLLIDDCIKNGRDYNNGGARYNSSYIQGVGLGSITDSLTAIKYHVFDQKTISMADFLSVIGDNFENHESFHNDLLEKTPKFGNDDDYADEIMKKVFESYFRFIDGRPNTKNGMHRVNLLPTTCHVYFGSVIDATPDGRRSGMPLSEGISPVQGADRHGPTAVIKSVSKIDHLRTGGTLLNQKFTPLFFSDDKAVDKLTSLIRAYFRLDGHHIQFNVVDAETLRDAQKHPENYRDLIVRVAGYSDYFIDLGVDLQNEIIMRTEQGVV
ncbi:MAG: glycyl radical protein [Calditrichaceae bacterium]|nr:glycyl radical protein [Calditrichaceae bacterium]MBN2710144.1 glycyl radical protein [Calditrichaceae bacterium]RQV95797.1 MAG: glycyl radical protein [Calditrichota bacterium]